MAYFINPSHQPACLYVYPHIVVRLQLGKKFTVAKNTHTTIEDFLTRPFVYMRSV
jgi:hypothetical protein